MKQLVIIPGGFHPFHAGHLALYTAAKEAFPRADIYIAATADTSERPFPFELKKKLARFAGVPAHRFIQVKSPFRAEEITQHYDPATTELIFVRSEKDQNSQPKPGGTKKDGTPAYLQPYRRGQHAPMTQHGFMAYLPTVQFGPGMTSATEIRGKWPELDDSQKQSLIQSLYPDAAKNSQARDTIIKIFDQVLGSEEKVQEAWMKNDAEQGHIIYPDGGLGGYSPDTLSTAVGRHMQDVIEKIRAGDYEAADYMLYRWGVIESKVQALKQYYEFMKKNGRRPIAKDREIDLGKNPVQEQNNDYLDEKRIDEFGRGPMAVPIVAAALVDKFSKDKEQVSEARGPWYPKEFDNWQQDAVAYGFTIEKVPDPPTGQSVQAYYVKNPQRQIVGFWDGKSGNGLLTRTPQEYQAAISGQGMTAGGYAAYDKEVANSWKQVLPTIKKIITKI